MVELVLLVFGFGGGGGGSGSDGVGGDVNHCFQFTTNKRLTSPYIKILS